MSAERLDWAMSFSVSYMVDSGSVLLVDFFMRVCPFHSVFRKRVNHSPFPKIRQPDFRLFLPRPRLSAKCERIRAGDTRHCVDAVPKPLGTFQPFGHPTAQQSRRSVWQVTTSRALGWGRALRANLLVAGPIFQLGP